MTQLSATEGYYIGIDLGGTRIRAARYTPELEMQQRTETHTRSEEGQEAVIKRIVEQARIVWPTDGKPVLGVGVSAPGPTNPVSGIVVAAPNLMGWHNVALRDTLQSELGVATYLGNDANLAALAETVIGAARGYTDVLFLTISTGIGGGVITNGKLLIGSEGLGAECGHVIIVVENDKVSTLEKESAGPAIARQARAAIAAGEKSSVLDLAAGKVEAITTPMVTKAAESGDPLAIRLIERAGMIVGLGIVSFLHIFNPQIVILGGSVAEHTGDLFMQPLKEAIRTYAIDESYWARLIIAPAELGENVSLIGAAALALRKGGQ